MSPDEEKADALRASDYLASLPALEVARLFRAGFLTRAACDLRRNAEIKRGFETYYSEREGTSAAKRFADDLAAGPYEFTDIPKKAQLILNVWRLNGDEALGHRRLYDLRGRD